MSNQQLHITIKRLRLAIMAVSVVITMITIYALSYIAYKLALVYHTTILDTEVALYILVSSVSYATMVIIMFYLKEHVLTLYNKLKKR